MGPRRAGRINRCVLHFAQRLVHKERPGLGGKGALVYNQES
jgi:hypothetical protein